MCLQVALLDSPPLVHQSKQSSARPYIRPAVRGSTQTSQLKKIQVACRHPIFKSQLLSLSLFLHILYLILDRCVSDLGPILSFRFPSLTPRLHSFQYRRTQTLSVIAKAQTRAYESQMI